MTKTDAERQRFVRAYMETPKIAEIKNFREIANQYLDLISAIKSGWFKAYSPK